MTHEQAYREGVYASLKGNLIRRFDGSNGAVSVYDGQVTTDNDNIYVLLSTETTNDLSNRTRFVKSVSLLLEIIHRAEYSIESRVLDDIEEQVIDQLTPTPLSTGIVPQTGFQFSVLRVENGNKLNMAISPTSTINRKLLTITCRVAQLN